MRNKPKEIRRLKTEEIKKEKREGEMVDRIITQKPQSYPRSSHAVLTSPVDSDI